MKTITMPSLGGGSNMAEIVNCLTFVAENGNLVHISADLDTKIVTETEISFSEGRKTEIVNIIVADIGNYGSWEPNLLVIYI